MLFHDIGKPPTYSVDETGRIRFNGHEYVSAEMTDKIMRRLRFSNEETEATIEMVRNHMAFKDVQQMRVAKLKRFMARPTFEDELELHRVDCMGSHGMVDNYHFLHAKQEEFANEPLIPLSSADRTRPHLNGLETGAVFSRRCSTPCRLASSRALSPPARRPWHGFIATSAKARVAEFSRLRLSAHLPSS